MFFKKVQDKLKLDRDTYLCWILGSLVGNFAAFTQILEFRQAMDKMVYYVITAIVAYYVMGFLGLYTDSEEKK